VATIAILGCGPAGLAAAEAAVSLGHSVIIASSSNKPSKIYGCQYLHEPVPGYEEVPHTRVGYWLNGTPDQYRKKVYGEKWKGKVSPEDFVGEHDAWDIRATYTAMWDRLHNNRTVHFVRIHPIANGELPDTIYNQEPKIIISTIPARALCYVREHEFLFHSIWAMGSTTKGLDADDTIICDGTEEHTWYRQASVFGYRTTEWSRNPTGGEIASAVVKPLATSCNCYPHIYRIGRYGKWLKSYLVHEAYPDVTRILRDA
jgi:hypothetical protein